MGRIQLVNEIIESAIVAIIRTDRDEQIPEIVEALLKGGVRFIEITTNTPNALQWISTLDAENHEDLVIGAGTVLNKAMTEQCIDAGARFLVTPFSRKEVIEEAHKLDIPVISGAMTPGEIAEAHEMGADMVKIFPAEFFGPKYIKAVKAPLDYVKLAPTGGINTQNAGEWLKAGADALGVGSALFTTKILEQKDYKLISENARALVEAVKNTRSDISRTSVEIHQAKK